MDIATVLTDAYPGNVWSESGNNYANLTWDESNAVPKPSLAELEAAWPAVRYARDYAQVEQTRHSAYIADADPLFFKWQRGTGTEQAWRDAVQTVKDSNPYPIPPAE